mgnify:CR=1 FL=1
MEAMSTNLGSDQLEKWRQAIATLHEPSGASMLRAPAALSRGACAALRKGVDTRGTVTQDTVDNLPNVDWRMSVAELRAVIGDEAAQSLFRLPQQFHSKGHSTPGETSLPQPVEPTRVFARRYSAAGGDDQVRPPC